MTVQSSVLIASQQLTASNATYYTSVNTTIIDNVTLCNTSASAVTVTIDVVQSGGTAGASKRVLSAKGIAPGDTYVAFELANSVMAAGDTIQGLASTASAVTIRASGRKVSGV